MLPIVKLWRKVLQNHLIKANLNCKLKRCPRNKSSSKKKNKKKKRKKKIKNTIMNLQGDMHTNTKNLALSLTLGKVKKIAVKEPTARF